MSGRLIYCNDGTGRAWSHNPKSGRLVAPPPRASVPPFLYVKQLTLNEPVNGRGRKTGAKRHVKHLAKTSYPFLFC